MFLDSTTHTEGCSFWFNRNQLPNAHVTTRGKSQLLEKNNCTSATYKPSREFTLHRVVTIKESR